MTAVNYRGQATLITGASSGIGAAFARALAARGSDLMLVARREHRLTELADELKQRHGIRAVPVPLDLSIPGAGATLVAHAEDNDLDITSVINNAGFGVDGPFHEQHLQRLHDELNVNLHNLVDITHAFIGRLREAGNGVLINVSSTGAYTPMPGMAIYAASKAFTLSFTEALWAESLGTGVRVLALSPGLTESEFISVLGTENYSGRFQTPDEVAQIAMASLDKGNRQPSVVSGRLNWLMITTSRLLTRRRATLIAGAMHDGGGLKWSNLLRAMRPRP